MSFSPGFPGSRCHQQSLILIKRLIFGGKHYSVAVSHCTINDKTFKKDSYTNVTPKIISRLSRKILNEKYHPICLLKERITNYFYETFKNKRGNPIFSLYDDLSPIVTTQQNFDSLLVPRNHSSRSKSDCYYINEEWLLRSHMTAHQSDLIKMGLNSFLMAGDVYRRDAIDHCHYPVFHQLDGVRLFTPEELFADSDDGTRQLEVMEKKKCERTEKQGVHTMSAVKMVERELKKTLEGLSRNLFGGDIKYEWCDAVFPFTHPSWELNIFMNGKWVEVLGCGVVEHEILENAGCDNRIGWAFGLGLDRLAMIYYSIPDIRIFWSTDPAFLRQFEGKTWQEKVTFKPFSSYPVCCFDISFWLNSPFSESDFVSVVRDFGGEDMEHIQLIDSYVDPKSGKQSRCYRVFYRSMEKTFSKKELAGTHKALETLIKDKFNVQIR